MSDLFLPGNVAVVTGAALGIGRATCCRVASAGMKVCMVDLPGEDFDAAIASVSRVATDRGNIMAAAVDVADYGAMEALAASVEHRFGSADILFNNAVTRIGRGMWADLDEWKAALDVNLWGVIHGVRAFAPAMIAQGRPAAIINAGSKQGITNPPGHPVYNLAKAALKSYTESLAHDLRNTEGARVSAHLLVPGWTTTGHKEHRQGAWRPEQVVEMMIDSVHRGSFYIICPDDEVTPEMDRLRVLWSAGDIAEDRPALSRWHPDFKDAFERFKG
ncbi:MAG: SDR family NAD(P)-dependent oxidoreductase [Rhodospirillales bacterium]